MRRWSGAAAAVTMLATGCMTSSYSTGLPGGGEMHLEAARYHLWGLMGDKTLDLSQVCPNGVAHWRDYVTLGDWLITCVACGGLIYGSETIEIECAGPGPTSQTSYLLVPDRAHHQTEVIPHGRGPGPETHS
jgi:hypothetical protein